MQAVKHTAEITLKLVWKQIVKQMSTFAAKQAAKCVINHAVKPVVRHTRKQVRKHAAESVGHYRCRGTRKRPSAMSGSNVKH